MRFFGSWADSALFDDPPSGGGGGGAAADGTGGSPAAAASGEGVVAAPPGSGTPDPSPAATTLYKPEGLADHLLGTSDNETIDNLAKALKGYRDRDGQVPEKPEAYKQFGDVDQAIKPFVDQLTGDPLFDRLTSKAKERGIPLQQFQGLTTDLMTLGAEMGIFEPPLDTAAERTALTPDTAKHLPEAEQRTARERRMNDNFAFLDLQVAKDGASGGLSKEAVEFAKQMLGDRAYGHQLIEHFRSMSQNGNKGPILPGAGSGGGADARSELSRRAALPENTPGHQKFDRASWDRLQADYKAAYGS